MPCLISVLSSLSRRISVWIMGYRDHPPSTPATRRPLPLQSSTSLRRSAWDRVGTPYLPTGSDEEEEEDWGGTPDPLPSAAFESGGERLRLRAGASVPLAAAAWLASLSRLRAIASSLALFVANCNWRTNLPVGNRALLSAGGASVPLFRRLLALLPPAGRGGMGGGTAEAAAGVVGAEPPSPAGSASAMVITDAVAAGAASAAAGRSAPGAAGCSSAGAACGRGGSGGAGAAGAGCPSAPLSS